MYLYAIKEQQVFGLLLFKKCAKVDGMRSKCFYFELLYSIITNHPPQELRVAGRSYLIHRILFLFFLFFSPFISVLLLTFINSSIISHIYTKLVY